MSALWLSNILAYSTQLTALVGVALVAAWTLRIRAPRPALWLWNIVLLCTVIVPIALAWQSPDAVAPAALAQIGGLSASGAFLTRTGSSIAETLLALVLGGAALKLAWLLLGLARLSVIRRRALPISPLPPLVADLSRQLNTSASVRVSDDVECPVTLGFRRPLVLLPRRVLTMPEAMQRAVICHELLHVRRRDWLQTIVERVWSATLWFHPAAHLLLSRITLMREAVVDEETIAITGDRKAYAQTLLAFAEPSTVAPLPLMHLIKPRHLPRRIALIAQEVRMSRRHSVAALASALVLATVATQATARRMPLAMSFSFDVASMPANATQEAFKPGDGVTLPRLVSDVKPQYTQAAKEARIQGSVFLEVVVETSGKTGRIKVTKSLDEKYGLDNAAVEAASQWRFEPGRKDDKPVPVQVTVEMTFTLK